MKTAFPDIPVAPHIEEDTQEIPVEEPLYKVLIHNDDVTPMDFVVMVLEKIFFLTRPDAMGIMLTAHYTGLAYVQTLPKSEAQKRIGKAQFAAGLEGYPLKFSMEPE
ncbi:MAG: ATP-dependent Clp protease adaptor ClpS [Anaerolineales bacterium]